jgi:hypothetical protein
MMNAMGGAGSRKIDEYFNSIQKVLEHRFALSRLLNRLRVSQLVDVGDR